MIQKTNVKLINKVNMLRSCHNEKITLITKTNPNKTKINLLNKRQNKIKKCVIEEKKRLFNKSSLSKLKTLRDKCINFSKDNNLSKNYLKETESFMFKLVKKNILSFNKAKKMISSLAISISKENK